MSHTLRVEPLDFKPIAEAQDDDLPVLAKDAKISVIRESVTVPPDHELPWVFELGTNETLNFTFCSQSPLDLLFTTMSEFDAWRECGRRTPPLVYMEAIQTEAQGVEFTPSAEGAYVAVLINEGSRAVDADVEIRFIRMLS